LVESLLIIYNLFVWRLNLIFFIQSLHFDRLSFFLSLSSHLFFIIFT